MKVRREMAKTMVPNESIAGEKHTTGSVYGRVVVLFLIVAVLATAGIMYAEPIKDGDLWFHLAYGRFMVENHTLVPDHTMFSWTRTEGSEIYCAWLSEIMFYLMYKAGGLIPLFVSRYVMLLVFVSLVCIFAWRHRIFWNPITWLICLVGILMSLPGLIIKPEMLSYVFMTITVFLWFTIKTSPSEKACRYCYLLPVVYLLWINSHGGIIFGWIFLGVVSAGEVVNEIFSREESLAPVVRNHFILALGLCALSTICTPYGWEYPAQLIQNFLIDSQAKVTDFMTVGAYQSIFHPQARGHHFIDYLVTASIVLVLLSMPKLLKRKPDWSLILLNIVFALLYMKFIRATYFWAIIFTFSSLCLLASRPDWTRGTWRMPYKYIQVFIVVVFVFFSGRAFYESFCKPLFGFWINYINPVEEAEFIRHNLPGLRMGNDYDSGCYLLWALAPEQKVFIDARYFPYKTWYREYAEFLYGKDLEYKDRFVRKYPCDFWCLTYDFPQISYFVQSPEWDMVYYGPSACIFMSNKEQTPILKQGSGITSGTLRYHQAVKIIHFLLLNGELEAAASMAEGLEKSPICPGKNELIALAYVELGNAQRKKGDTDKAIFYFHKAFEFHKITDPDVSVELGNLLQRKGEVDKAIEHYQTALRMQKDHIPALRSLAHAYAAKREYQRTVEILEKLIKQYPGEPSNYYDIACIYSLKNDREQATYWLQKAVEKGFSNWELLGTDNDLNNIRGTPYFKDLLRGR